MLLWWGEGVAKLNSKGFTTLTSQQGESNEIQVSFYGGKEFQMNSVATPLKFSTRHASIWCWINQPQRYASSFASVCWTTESTVWQLKCCSYVIRRSCHSKELILQKTLSQLVYVKLLYCFIASLIFVKIILRGEVYKMLFQWSLMMMLWSLKLSLLLGALHWIHCIVVSWYMIPNVLAEWKVTGQYFVSPSSPWLSAVIPDKSRPHFMPTTSGKQPHYMVQDVSLTS